MNEKAKEIVASFLKVAPASVTGSTIIDNNALHSSVLIHRMYATLLKEGIKVSNPQDIRTFGDLLDALGNGDGGGTEGNKGALRPRPSTSDSSARDNSIGSDAGLLIGIDIEDVDNMPQTDDYREDEFYSLNFSEREISHCILQPDIRMSFAGKFAAKEAIVKANNSFMDTPFSRIEILNDKNGKPFFEGFVISIAHAGNHAISVAARQNRRFETNDAIPKEDVSRIVRESLMKNETQNRFVKKISMLAIFAALTALVLTLLT